MKLGKEFYMNGDVVAVARQLLGKVIVSYIDNKLTSGYIVETEAYSVNEKGCHAYNYKNTKRTKTMFCEGGISYIYLCYGVHHLFNIVTNGKDEPEAVLIRAIEPIEGIDIMIDRRGTKGKGVSSGPGKLTKALGIAIKHNQTNLLGDEIWIEEGKLILDKDIISSTRIGIDYAGDDAMLPWRFFVRNNNYVSRQ